MMRLSSTHSGRLFELPVHEADAGNQRGDVGAGGFGRSGGDLEWRLAQYIEHTAGVERGCDGA